MLLFLSSFVFFPYPFWLVVPSYLLYSPLVFSLLFPSFIIFCIFSHFFFSSFYLLPPIFLLRLLSIVQFSRFFLVLIVSRNLLFHSFFFYSLVTFLPYSFIFTVFSSCPSLFFSPHLFIGVLFARLTFLSFLASTVSSSPSAAACSPGGTHGNWQACVDQREKLLLLPITWAPALLSFVSFFLDGLPSLVFSVFAVFYCFRSHFVFILLLLGVYISFSSSQYCL